MSRKYYRYWLKLRGQDELVLAGMDSRGFWRRVGISNRMGPVIDASRIERVRPIWADEKIKGKND